MKKFLFLIPLVTLLFSCKTLNRGSTDQIIIENTQVIARQEATINQLAENNERMNEIINALRFDSMDLRDVLNQIRQFQNNMLSENSELRALIRELRITNVELLEYIEFLQAVIRELGGEIQ